MRATAIALALLVSAAAAAATAAAPPRTDVNPLFNAEWWLRGHGTVLDWTGGERPSDGVGAVDVWQETTGVGVTVAVLDSGVDRHVPELQDRLLPGRDFLGGGPVNGDAFGHGTHISTLIAGDPPAGRGIVGVAPDARILPLRIGTRRGHVVDAAAAAALGYALGYPGVRVVNMSWGKPYTHVLGAALAATAAHGSVLLVSAAGNDGSDLSDGRLLPQTFDGDAEITVASSDLFDFLSAFSNYGAHVEVAAPGEEILSRLPGELLKLADGTSDSAALVSGVAALLFARYPAATAAQVKQAIVSSCARAPDLAAPVTCGGVVDAPAALAALAQLLAR